MVIYHIFNSRTVEQSETWKTRNELEYLSKLLKDLTVKNVCSV